MIPIRIPTGLEGFGRNLQDNLKNKNAENDQNTFKIKEQEGGIGSYLCSAF